MNNKQFLSGLILASWLIGTGYAFWWFQSKDIRMFDLQAEKIIDEQVLTNSLNTLLAELQTDPETTYLIHFWKPDCSCNRFNRIHVREIAEKYRHDKFQMITVTQPHNNYSDYELIQMAKQEFSSHVVIDHQYQLSDKARIPAAPAAAVIDKTGNLAYFGPYSDSSFCGLGGTAFVERVTDLLFAGENTSMINTLVAGCFCNWDKNTLQKV